MKFLGSAARWLRWSAGGTGRAWAAGLLLGLTLSRHGHALPGVIAAATDAPRRSSATQVVTLRSGTTKVVSVSVDYRGPLDKFALVLPVPVDVKASTLRTLKRDVFEHIDEVTAPRIAEFWEMDPCEPGDAQQEWERDLRVKGNGPAVQGLDGGGGLPSIKHPELSLNLDPEFKSGEYQFTLLKDPKALLAHLSKAQLKLPSGAAEELDGLAGQSQFLVAQVNSRQVELVGTDRVILSPIRFTTNAEYEPPLRLGARHSPGQQEVLVYVLDPKSRYEAKELKTVAAPTNVRVKPEVKEHFADLYSGLVDKLWSTNTGAAVLEYAWPAAKPCGEPCPASPLGIAELLTLGADELEALLPAAVRRPKPGAMSGEEQAAFAAADRGARKAMSEAREELARRRGLLERHQYVLTRLHLRYTADAAPTALGVRPATAAKGGTGVPEGELGQVSPAAAGEAGEGRFQTRFNVLHESKAMVQCQAPRRFRWGRAPATYRGLRDIVTARGLESAQRDRFTLPEMVLSPVPELGLVPATSAASASAPPAGLPAPETTSKTGCVSSGTAPTGRHLPLGLAWLGLALPALVSAWRRRSSAG